MLMGQNLDLSTDQISLFIIAARILRGHIGLVGVKNDLFLFTDQLGLSFFLHRSSGQFTDKPLLPRITVVGMLVIAVNTAGQLPDGLMAAFIVVMSIGDFKAANRCPGFIHTAFTVLVAVAFFQTANQFGGFRITIICMYMLRADQRPTLQSIAFV